MCTLHIQYLAKELQNVIFLYLFCFVQDPRQKKILDMVSKKVAEEEAAEEERKHREYMQRIKEKILRGESPIWVPSEVPQPRVMQEPVEEPCYYSSDDDAESTSPSLTPSPPNIYPPLSSVEPELKQVGKERRKPLIDPTAYEFIEEMKEKKRKKVEELEMYKLDEFEESQIDEEIEKMRMDPLFLQIRKNLNDPDVLPHLKYRPPRKKTRLTHEDLMKVLEYHFRKLPPIYPRFHRYNVAEQVLREIRGQPDLHPPPPRRRQRRWTPEDVVMAVRSASRPRPFRTRAELELEYLLEKSPSRVPVDPEIEDLLKDFSLSLK